jgi:hypothetical protein
MFPGSEQSEHQQQQAGADQGTFPIGTVQHLRHPGLIAHDPLARRRGILTAHAAPAV